MRTQIMLALLTCHLLFSSAYAQATNENEKDWSINSTNRPEANLLVYQQTPPQGLNDSAGNDSGLILQGEVLRQIRILELSIQNGLNRVIDDVKPKFWETLRDSYISSLTWEFLGIHRNQQASNILRKILTAGGALLLLLKILFWIRRLSRDKMNQTIEGPWSKVVNGTFVVWSAFLLVPVTIQVWSGGTSAEIDIANAVKAFKQTGEFLNGIPTALMKIEKNQNYLQNLLESRYLSLSNDVTHANEVPSKPAPLPVQYLQISAVGGGDNLPTTNYVDLYKLSTDVAELRRSLATNLIISATAPPYTYLRTNLDTLLARLPHESALSTLISTVFKVFVAVGLLAVIIFSKDIRNLL